jgi:long-subunit fatty acid transport protein
MRSINKNSKLKYATNIMMVLIFTVLVFSGGRLHAATLFQQVGVSSSPNPVGSGARAVGMGGAFIAIADDATAASWNPAGLIQLETPELSAVGAYFDRREDFSSDTHPEINNTGKTDDVNMNYFSGSYPFKFHRNMVVSINYQRLYEFERNFDYRYDYSSLGVDLLQDKHFNQDGHVGALGLAYSIEVTPKISFGITLNIWTDELLWQNGWEETFSERGVGTQGGVPVTIDTHITDKYSEFRGVNANFGVLWDMNKHLTLGAVIKTPFDASIRHEYSFKQTSTFGPPISTTVTSQQSIAEYVELGMPMSYGIGLAFSPIDGRPKSESNVKDTTQVRFGGEYLFIQEERNLVVPLRAGFFYDPEPADGKVKDFYGFTIGSGIAYKRYIFDMAYQLRWGHQVDTGNLIANSKADVTQHLILASVIYHF